MNEEKKIAQAILDAQKMREESYVESPNKLSIEAADIGIIIPTGDYTKDIEECLIATCKEQGLSSNLWALLDLTIHQQSWNDIQLWAEDVLAGKNILEGCEKENAKIKTEQNDTIAGLPKTSKLIKRLEKQL